MNVFKNVDDSKSKLKRLDSKLLTLYTNHNNPQ